MQTKLSNLLAKLLISSRPGEGGSNDSNRNRLLISEH